MKVTLVLAVLVAVVYGSAIPNPGDEYVPGETRYIWMPVGDEGEMTLVDLHDKPSEEEISREIARNGANNQYWLFTRRNPHNAQIITHGQASSIWASQYLGGHPIIVIVHGWNNNGNSDVNTRLRNAFLHVMEANVIVVDWRGLANSGYWTAVNGVPSVGQHVGDFINWLINTAGGNWNNVHFIGYSLGAHIVGNAGRRVGNQPRRITGLDPAGPEWGGNGNALRASDGGYVECIHTNGGALGIMDPICQANFYPNGGRNQAGCALVNINCSHGRSYMLMESSVYSNHLIGRQCANMNSLNNCNGAALHMGNHLMNKNGNGLFWLNTGSSWPF